MKTGNCKVGDLAISVNTDLPENAGVIVEVLAVNVDDPAWSQACHPLCLVRAAGTRPLHLNRHDGRRWNREIVREAVVPDNRLLPITPPEKDTEVHRDLEISAR